jgi:hypothetical protein
MKNVTYNGKVYRVDENAIRISQEKLGLSYTEAVQMYLEDECILDNEEQNELDKKAKREIYEVYTPTENNKKTRVRKSSAEKKDIFNKIATFLQENYENVEILKENKLIGITIGDKKLKLDLIEQRKPKK